MKRIFRSELGRTALAAVAVALFLIAATFVQDIGYMTNDDNAIAFALAGYETGSPYPYAMFISFLLGAFVSGLYSAFPSVAWWGVLQIVGLAVSGVILLRCVLKTGEESDCPVLLRLSVCGMLLLSVLLNSEIELTYTVTAAVIGASGVALLLTAGQTKKRGVRIAEDAVAFVQVVIAFLIREETGFAVLCFVFLAVLYRVFACRFEKTEARGNIAGNLRSVGAAFVAVLVLIGGAFLWNNHMKVAVNGEEYMAFFAARERFTDYPRDTFEQNPTLYEQAGWTENVYRLADDWCFLDERIDTESLTRITENSVHTGEPSLGGAVRMLAEAFDEAVPDRLLFVGFLLLVFAAGVSFALNGHRGGAELVTMLLAVLGGAVLCVYLNLTGRAPMRALRAVLIPMTAVIAVLFCRVPIPEAGKKYRRFALGTAVLAVASTVLGGALSARELHNSGAQWQNERCHALYAYASEHRENVYLRDAYSYSDQDVFTTYSDADAPINLISWGGCGMRSEAYRRHLAVNGVDPDDAAFFLGDNVYFVAAPWRDDLRQLFERYLIEEHGAKGLEEADTIPDVATIYRVVK